jgi:hypothetical protein
MTDKPGTCEAVRDSLSLLVSADAAVPEATQARQHLADCAECRAYLAGLQADADQLDQFAASHEPLIRTLMLQTINALPETPPGTTLSSRRWRWLLDRRVQRLAAVAAVVVFLVVYFQGTGPTFDAWAEVIASVRKATTAQFRLRDMTGSDVEARQAYSAGGTSHRTYEDGRLVEAMFVDFTAAELLYLAYPLQFGARMTLTEELIADHRRHDPAETFDFLQEYEFEDLGQRRIDGRTAVGIRVTDARFLAERMERAELELWVDPETKLPIRFDVTGEVDGGRRTKHVRFDQFVWNESLPADEFAPPVPEGFRLIDGVDLAVDEDHALAGLRLFADVVGRYPTSLAYESLKVELWQSPGARRRDVAAMVVDMFRIRLASTFYGSLVRDRKDVVYFGHRTRPGDGDRVLLRWRLADDSYRVVFGDLRTADVDGARLLDLESR